MLTFLRRLKMSKKWIVIGSFVCFVVLLSGLFFVSLRDDGIRLVYEMIMLTRHLKKNYHSQTSRSWSAV